MTAHRTVFWLALLTAVVPFLAIPEMLMQLVVAVLAVVIMITVRIARPDTQSQRFEPPQIDGDDSGNTDQESRQTDSAKTNKDDTDQADNDENPVDVTDPDADRMVASGQWRRRSSRKIGDDNSS